MLVEARAGIGRTVVAASFGFALVQLDVTIVNVALPQIATDFGGGITGLQWVIDAYALSFAVLLLGAGSLGDRFGPRRIYFVGLAVFGAASLACGMAPGSGLLVGARAVQGAGAAAMLPCSLALINIAAGEDARLRAKAIGWWAAAGSIAVAAGPILGGLLVTYLGWRSIFLVNLPICLVGAVLTRGVSEAPPKRGHARFDVPGQVLAILGLAGVIGALIEVKPLGAESPVVLGAAAIGIAGCAGLIAVEARVGAPMLPLRLFRDRVFSAAVSCGVLLNLTFYGMLFVLSLYLQRVLGFGAAAAGLAFLPLTASVFGANVTSGWWAGRVGPRPPMVTGALLAAAGFGVLLLIGATTPYVALAPAFVLMATGLGLCVPAMTSSALAQAGTGLSGLASGVLNAARQAGGAIGVAIFGALAGLAPAGIVVGMHRSAGLAVAALGLTALLAGLCMGDVRRRPGG